MSQLQIRGVSAIAVTPYDDDLRVDHAALGSVVRGMDQAGVHSIVACGGLAEYYALSHEERLAVARTTVAAVSHSVPLVAVGLGVENAVAEARAAEEAGAAGILVHPPVHPYVHEAALLDYYEAVADSVRLPLVAYVRDPALDDDAIRALAAMERVIAIKYAINDLPRFADLVESSSTSVAWLCGSAETWAPYFWTAGAVGYTSGIANFAPAATLRLLAALENGADREEVRRVWAPLRHLESIRFRRHDRDSIAVVKAGVALAGLAGDAVRPPMRRVDEDTRAEIAQLMRTSGLLPVPA